MGFVSPAKGATALEQKGSIHRWTLLAASPAALKGRAFPRRYFPVTRVNTKRLLQQPGQKKNKPFLFLSPPLIPGTSLRREIMSRLFSRLTNRSVASW